MNQKKFDKLDVSIKKHVLKKLILLEINPFLGKPLVNKAGIDLTGCYELYVFKKKIRIIYKVIDQKLIITIISIGKRENLAANYLAYLRGK